VRSAAVLRTAAQQGLDGAAGPSGLLAAQQRLQQQQAVFGAALGQPAFRALAAALQQHALRREGWRGGRLRLLHATNERRCGQAPLYGWAPPLLPLLLLPLLPLLLLLLLLGSRLCHAADLPCSPGRPNASACALSMRPG
jgi:hypothetical protein